MKTKIKKNIGVSGVAQVKILKDAVRVIYPDGDQYDVPKNNLPDGLASGNYSVTMSATGDKIVFLAPPPLTTNLVRFKEFSNRDNGVPEPKIKRGGPRKGKNGAQWIAPDELVFIPMLEIVEGQYKGLTIPYSLNYGFEPDPGTPYTLINASAGRLAQIEEFFRAAGFDLAKEEIPFSDNILPWLENRLNKAHRIFSVSLNKDGYVDKLAEIPEYLLPPELAKAPSAKTTKKSKK